MLRRFLRHLYAQPNEVPFHHPPAQFAKYHHAAIKEHRNKYKKSQTRTTRSTTHIYTDTHHPPNSDSTDDFNNRTENTSHISHNDEERGESRRKLEYLRPPYVNANETRVGALKKKITYIFRGYIGAFLEQCDDDVCVTFCRSPMKCRVPFLYVVIASNEHHVRV